MSQDFFTTPYVAICRDSARVKWEGALNSPPIDGEVPLLREGDAVLGVRRYGTCTLSVNERSHNENNNPSLIPDASVIASHVMIEDTRRKVELSSGDYVAVEGFGLYRVVKGTMRNGGNADWPKLIPQAERYFVTYEGSENYQCWSIQDRDLDGERVLDEAAAAFEVVTGDERPHAKNLREANAVCALLNLWHAR